MLHTSLIESGRMEMGDGMRIGSCRDDVEGEMYPKTTES